MFKAFCKQLRLFNLIHHNVVLQHDSPLPSSEMISTYAFAIRVCCVPPNFTAEYTYTFSSPNPIIEKNDFKFTFGVKHLSTNLDNPVHIFSHVRTVEKYPNVLRHQPQCQAFMERQGIQAMLIQHAVLTMKSGFSLNRYIPNLLGFMITYL